MAHFTIPCGTLLLSLVHVNILETSCSLADNSLAGAQFQPNASKNHSDYALSLVSPSILPENDTGIGSMLLKVVRSVETPPNSENSNSLDGFQFVDSPDVVTHPKINSPETKPGPNDSFRVGGQFNSLVVNHGNVIQDSSTYSTTRGTNKGRNHAVSSGVIEKDNWKSYSNGSGAIEKNYWKSYSNGTIIHDVRISLVHPANMGVLVNGGFPWISAPVELNESLSDPHLGANEEGRGSLDPAQNSSNNNDTYRNSTLTAIEEDLWGNGSTDADNNDGVDDFNSTEVVSKSTVDFDSTDVEVNTTRFWKSTRVNMTEVHKSIMTPNTAFALTNKTEVETKKSDMGAGGKISLEGKLPPVINVGISINTKGQCLSECLTKCATAESNCSETASTKVPVCSSNSSHSTFIPPIAEKLGGTPNSPSVDYATVDEADDSTASVPVLLIGESREDFFDNGSSVDGDGKSVELGKLENVELLEPKPKFLLEEVCLSEKCVLKSADILRRMDKSADPCNSFYNFACGTYLKNEIPTGVQSKSIFSDISSDNVARTYSVLKSPIADDDRLYIRVLKRFFGKCSLSSPNDLFAEVVKELGGWPSPYSPSLRVPKNVWGEIAFNWTFGMFLEYNLVSINLTYPNSTAEWILNVDYPQFVKAALVSNSFYDLSEIERDLKSVANALGISNSTIRTVLLDLRIFMASAIKYAKATMFYTEKGLYSLKCLRAKFSHLDVFKELPSLLKTVIAIDEDEMIHVSNMGYLRKIDELLRDSPVRTQANHLVLNSLRVLSVLIGMSDDESRDKYCVKLTGKLFPRLVGHLHSSTLVSDSQVASATKIVSRIQDSLLGWLNDSISDNNLREKAIEKVRKLVFIWNNRNELNDDIAGIAKSFDENTSFSNFVKTGIWNFKKATYTYLRRPVNDSFTSFVERYSGDGYSVNAYYFFDHISIPPSALHESIFDSNVPPYVSFGGLGLIVGHELIHSILAVDDLVNSTSYIKMEKCMVNRFNSFPQKFSGDRESGDLKKEENIADYGGFKVAYRAFSEWYKHFSYKSKEKKLPGLQTFNEKQMFWLTAAANWCRKISHGSTASSADKHAPPEYRVDGQFANIPEFAEDFNCPVDSPMNPKQKCTLW